MGEDEYGAQFMNELWSDVLGNNQFKCIHMIEVTIMFLTQYKWFALW
jgi:hypothetical protein